MDGLMTFFAQNGSRNHSFHKQLHKTHLEKSPFCSFMMVMALMTLQHSAIWHKTIILLYSAFLHIPPTSCNLWMLGCLVLSRGVGLIDVIRLWRTQERRCLMKMLFRSTWQFGK